MLVLISRKEELPNIEHFNGLLLLPADIVSDKEELAVLAEEWLEGELNEFGVLNLLSCGLNLHVVAFI